MNRVEAVIRVFNKYGNRKNKNKARLKFVVRERGFDGCKEQIEERISGHPGQRRHLRCRTTSRKALVVFKQYHHRSATGELLPVLEIERPRRIRNTSAGSKPTFASRSSPATRSSR